jgi:hypothetical protein
MEAMATQDFINIIIAVAGFFGGWTVNSLSRSILRIEDKLSDLPLQYVTKDDYRRDITEIKNMLDRIFEKLDDKADK